MSEILRYVDPNSTAGGDGTAQVLTGAARAYVSLNAWEAATQQNLVTGGNTARVVCSSNLDAGGGNADTTAVTVDGWTTGVNNYITVEASSSHGGKWNANIYRRQTSDSISIQIYEDFVRVSGLQIYTLSISTTNQGGIFLRGSSRTSGYFLFQKNIIRGPGATATNYINGIQSYQSGTFTADYTNNIIYDFGTGGTAAGGIAVWDAGNTVNVYNCTIHNSYIGVFRNAGTVTAKNVGAASCTTPFSGTITQTTCSSSSPTFVDEANDDFHLAAGDTTWKDAGTDLSGTFTDDVDGQTRSGTWDIGADEYVAAGGGRTADLGVTLAGCVVAAAAGVLAAAVLSVQLAGATVASSAIAPVVADLSKPVDSATVEASAAARIATSLDAGLQGATVGAGISVPVTSTVSAVLQGATVGAGVSAPITSTVSAVLDDATLLAAASVGEVRVADAVVQLGGATIVSAASAPELVSLDAELAAVTIASEASAPEVVSLDTELAGMAIAAVATELIALSLAAALDGATLLGLAGSPIVAAKGWKSSGPEQGHKSTGAAAGYKSKGSTAGHGG